MFSEINEDVVSSDTSNEENEKHFQELYFSQKSLNFKSEMEFLNLRFKTIGENLRREKTKLSKTFQNDVPHKFSIDNILGQLKSSENDAEVNREECFSENDENSPSKSPLNEGK